MQSGLKLIIPMQINFSYINLLTAVFDSIPEINNFLKKKHHYPLSGTKPVAHCDLLQLYHLKQNIQQVTYPSTSILHNVGLLKMWFRSKIILANTVFSEGQSSRSCTESNLLLQENE